MYRSARWILTVCSFSLMCAVSISAQETDQEKIREALAAAPPMVSADALVLDWPSSPDGEFRVLREGDNGWTCLPDLPGDDNYEPMCNDAQWMAWIRAFFYGEEPRTTALGFSYMLNSHGGTSNSDPTATDPSAVDDWVDAGGHLMIIVPDPAMLDHYPDVPGPGAYVMWKGTPWVHLMVPMEELVGPPDR
jgi:hypothetical protein